MMLASYIVDALIVKLDLKYLHRSFYFVCMDTIESAHSIHYPQFCKNLVLNFIRDFEITWNLSDLIVSKQDLKDLYRPFYFACMDTIEYAHSSHNPQFYKNVVLNFVCGFKITWNLLWFSSVPEKSAHSIHNPQFYKNLVLNFIHDFKITRNHFWFSSVAVFFYKFYF